MPLHININDDRKVMSGTLLHAYFEDRANAQAYVDRQNRADDTQANAALTAAYAVKEADLTRRLDEAIARAEGAENALREERAAAKVRDKIAKKGAEKGPTGAVQTGVGEKPTAAPKAPSP